MLLTSCASCGGILEPTYTGQESHPRCPSTESEKRARAFVDALQREDFAEADRLERELDKPSAVSRGSAALWYATVAKWPIFPCAVGEKRPATKNGFHDATTDESQIREWWAKGDWNIGGVTGIFYDALDIDGPRGFESIRELGDKVPTVHGRVNTPRGQHWYVKKTGDPSKIGLRPNLDWKAVGGYVLLPMSEVGGKLYTWTSKPSPEIMGT